MGTENKEELLKIWQIVEDNQRGYYKPTEITEKQLELIYDLTKLLNRRDASKLIDYYSPQLLNSSLLKQGLIL